MSPVTLSIGFMPLVDCAPLVIADVLGFAGDEGLSLDLQRAPSWATLRDRLALGQIDAAHMLSVVPVARELGLGGQGPRFEALSVLSVNGTVIGLSLDLAARLRDRGHGFDFADAAAAGRALIGAGQPLRIGVPFPFSMHAELLYYWLGSLGLAAPQGVAIRTVPPPLMADAIAAGEIDAFCVGEPWGSIAVENGVGELLLPGAAIWRFAPEKVLALRSGWAEAEPDLTGRLLRAVWRSGRWLSRPENRTTAAEILARRDHLNLSAEVIDRALTARLAISGRGEQRHVPGFVEFHEGAATFPWRSQAAWIGTRLAARMGLDQEEAADAARRVFRSDLYRQHLRAEGAVLPRASERIEGALREATPLPTESGQAVFSADAFFDGRTFDPAG